MPKICGGRPVWLVLLAIAAVGVGAATVGVDVAGVALGNTSATGATSVTGASGSTGATLTEDWPPRVKPIFPHPLPGEGVWRPTGPPVDGRPPVLVTVFRTELAYPRLVAYVAWFDHTRTAIGYYPGRYEPPDAAVRDDIARVLLAVNANFQIETADPAKYAAPSGSNAKR